MIAVIVLKINIALHFIASLSRLSLQLRIRTQAREDGANVLEDAPPEVEQLGPLPTVGPLDDDVDALRQHQFVHAVLGPCLCCEVKES